MSKKTSLEVFTESQDRFKRKLSNTNNLVYIDDSGFLRIEKILKLHAIRTTCSDNTNINLFDVNESINSSLTNEIHNELYKPIICVLHELAEDIKHGKLTYSKIYTRLENIIGNI